MKTAAGTAVRLVIYLVGIFLVSLGIVLCKRSNLGISPISSIPYALEDLIPLSFGTLTMLFHFVNIAMQLLLLREPGKFRILLQVPLAFAFGCVIDWIQTWLVFDGTILSYQIIALFASIFATALGMVCMIHMNLIQNPPDGLVRMISQKRNVELGKVKIIYDCLCVVISTVMSLVFLGNAKGLGAATILSMLLVGRTVTWLRIRMDSVRDAVLS
ncbi:MAG: DUF6198 family protein [Clostridiales bacterium]|nr:DUF6198 family protein [Clostridiales bacterium]